MNQKLVSVNITTYNRAHILSRCLDSILRQSYQNIEIIIVDDNSSDNTKSEQRERPKPEPDDPPRETPLNKKWKEE